jgi:pyruvate dehydrogenase E2 component (dihydrolipoamide acetyltransferase)
MPIELKMPALSPTMEEGTLAKWLVKEGDSVASGDLMAEIETDKATMEFEAVDEGVITQILVAEGTEGVKVGTVIALIQGEDEEAPVKSAATEPVSAEPVVAGGGAAHQLRPSIQNRASTSSGLTDGCGARVIASPLAKRIAAERGLDLSAITGTGPNGRIVKADVEGGTASASASAAPSSGAAISPLARKLAEELGVDIDALVGTGPAGRIVKADVEAAAAKGPAPTPATPSAPAPVAQAATPLTNAIPDFGIPFEDAKLSGMRKTIAKRLSQSMQEAPHIYLTVDIRLDALLKLRGELNETLADRGVKLSVNDMLIKALGLALLKVPSCNVSFGGDVLRSYKRADVSVAVSIPGGLITPIVTDAAGKSLATIATEAKDLAGRAKEGKLQPSEYQGGTASISNMGMMGIKQFTAVINPPQAMIMAVGAGEKRPYVLDDGSLGVATVMSCTGSFDHRAIDGADGAQLMAAFKSLVEKPLGLVA